MFIAPVAAQQNQQESFERWPCNAPVYKLFTLILLTLTATILCADF